MTDLSLWEELPPADSDGLGNTPQATAQVGAFPHGSGGNAGDPALLLQMSKGLEIGADTSGDPALAAMRYTAFDDSPLTPAAMRFYSDGGLSTDRWTELVSFRNADHSLQDAFLFSDLTSGGGTTGYIWTGAPRDWWPSVALLSTAAAFGTTIAGNKIWFALGSMGIMHHPVDRFGAPYTPPRNTYWLASEIAEDVFGRLLGSLIDPAALDIVESTFQIDTFAFMEPASAAAVLDQLCVLGNQDWGLAESTGNGQRAWFHPWPTEPRYILDERDQIEVPGTEDTLCNRVAVDWVGPRGKTHTTVVGAYVPELGISNPVLTTSGAIDQAFLDAGGRVKDADRVSLPDGHGSMANAIQAGTMALEEKNRVALSGTAQVTRPLVDLVTGDKVLPSGLEPGCVARLTPMGTDVRVTEVAYAHDDKTATLGLNKPIPTLARRLARLEARKRR